VSRARTTSAAIAAALLGACASSSRSAPTKPADASAGDPPIPSQCEAAVERASKLGVLLVQESLLADWAGDTARAAGLAGAEHLVAAITTRDSRGWVIHFVRRYQGDLTEPFQVTFVRPEATAASIVRFDPPRPLDPETSFLLQVRETATDEGVRPCGHRYTVLMLPGEVADEEGWLVYLIAIPERDGWVFGGQVRHVVNGDARYVLTTEPLTRGCAVMPEATPRPRMGNGTRPCPSEVDVWQSTLHRKPFEIDTEVGLWEVNGPRIRFLRPPRVYQKAAPRPG